MAVPTVGVGGPLSHPMDERVAGGRSSVVINLPNALESPPICHRSRRHDNESGDDKFGMYLKHDTRRLWPFLGALY